MFASAVAPAITLGRSLLPVVVVLPLVITASPDWVLRLSPELDFWRNLAMPLAVLALSFGALFGQWRIVSALALVLTASALLHHPPTDAVPGTERMLLLLTALALAALALLPERGLAGPAPLVATVAAALIVLAVVRGIPGLEPQVLDTEVLRIGGFKPALAPVLVAGVLLPVIVNQVGRPAVTRGAILAAVLCLLPLVDSAGARPLAMFYISAAVAALWTGLAVHAWQLAFVDELTGLPNRRALMRRLRAGANAVAMIDVDRFKAINDRYGHPVGDQVLRRVAAVLSADFGVKAYRYGGEEFAIVMNSGDPERVVATLERIRSRLAARSFRIRERRQDIGNRGGGGGTQLAVTASFGVAMDGSGESTADLIRRADAALYRAKSAGRNCVVVADP